MAMTGVVTQDKQSNDMIHVQLYINGFHIGYIKIDKSYTEIITGALIGAQFTVINA